MMMVFLKSTVRPWESVIRPSSRTCNNTLKTSGWAFSISSNKTILYGFRRTASVNWPPSSYPTYPGGAPIKRETLCFSMYSDISIRTICRSSSNSCSAKALATSVLPTPVGPKNIKEPIGRFSSWICAFERKIASVTNSSAWSWPTTRFAKTCSRWSNFVRSLSTKRLTSTPVQRETIFAIISSSTVSWIKAPSLSVVLTLAIFASSSGITPYCRRAASS